MSAKRLRAPADGGARSRSPAGPRLGGPGGFSDCSEERDERAPKRPERLQEVTGATKERAAGNGGRPSRPEYRRVDPDAHRRPSLRLAAQGSPGSFELSVKVVARLPSNRLQLVGHRVARRMRV